MRILVVEPHLGDNGAVRVTLDRAAHWAAAGDDVTLFVVHRYDPAVCAPVPDGLRVVHATPAPRREQVVLLAAARRMASLARRADVVVAGREIDVALLLAAAGRPLVRRPLAVTVQSRVDLALAHYVPERWQSATRWALRRADAVVPVAEGLTPGLLELGVRPDRVTVVRNGIDVAAVRAAALRAPEVELPAGQVVVASGRLVRQKGFDLLVRAHDLALRSGAPAHTLLLLGEGPDRSALEGLARSLGVEGSVRMPGHVANPHAVVARADLFALPSRWEGLPLGLVEALACGVPCVAADCVSGPREVLEAGELGALVPVEDVEALAGALVAHLRDPADLRERAQRGAAGAAARFDPAGAAGRHREVLGALVGAGVAG